MNILYISQYFYPEMGAPSARAYELSRYWVACGHNVTVLTSFPNYPDGSVYEGYETLIKKVLMHEEINGIKVVRVWAYPTHLRSPLRRGINYLSFFLSSSLIVPSFKNYDIVIATSPPPFLGLTGLLFSRLKGMPFIFEVRDLWPEVISAVGAAPQSSIQYKIFDQIVSLLYKKSTLIVALTNSFKETIASSRGIPEDKIKVIENAVDTEFFRPFQVSSADLRTLGLQDKFIVSYIGTIGLTHGVDVVLEAAKYFITKLPNLVFLLVGDGFEKSRLMKSKEQKKLNNVIFMNRQPRSNIPILINASDVSLVLSSKAPLLQKTIFAKAFEPMACGKPIIVGADGETKKIVVERARAGIYFKPESPNGLIEAIIELYENPDKRRYLGDNGRTFVVTSFSRLKKAKEYLEIIEEIVGHKNGRATIN